MGFEIRLFLIGEQAAVIGRNAQFIVAFINRDEQVGQGLPQRKRIGVSRAFALPREGARDDAFQTPRRICCSFNGQQPACFGVKHEQDAIKQICGITINLVQLSARIVSHDAIFSGHETQTEVAQDRLDAAFEVALHCLNALL